MRPSRFSLRFPFGLINNLGRALEAVRFPTVRLDERSVCRSAVRRSGLDDFGDPYYREGLLQLLKSLEEDAQLHFIGRITARELVIGYLVQRLRFIEAQARESERFASPMRPPLIVTGLARSGTTLLQRLLALDPANRALPQWLLMNPFPDRRAARDSRRERAKRTLGFRKPLLPDLDAIHYARLDTPEECILPLGLTFNSFVFALFPVYGYMDWYLAQEDVSKKYGEYGQLVRYFQSLDPDRRLVLKAPAHTPHLRYLKMALPEAMLIQTHRDPATCVASGLSLLYTLHGAVATEIDIERMARMSLETNALWIERNLEFRAALPGEIRDVEYDDLVEDPIGVVRGIYRRFDLCWPEGFEVDMERYLEANPRGRYGVHRYGLEEFGLTEKEIPAPFR